MSSRSLSLLSSRRAALGSRRRIIRSRSSCPMSRQTSACVISSRNTLDNQCSTQRACIRLSRRSTAWFQSEPPKSKNTFRSSLFPRTARPQDEDGKKKQRIQYPKTFAGWKRVFSCAWQNYRSTWEGFMGGSSEDDDEMKEKQNEKSEMEEMIEEQRKTVSDNVEKNVEFVKKEAPKFFDFVQKETKIYTKEDLKQWAGEQLKLATLCLNEFMRGYRSGRDGEMDRMLNEYFKEEDEEEASTKDAVKRKRRKRKRLVRSA